MPSLTVALLLLEWLHDGVYAGRCWERARTQQTDQTTTLCVQEVEIYLERWEVLGALVDVCFARANTNSYLPPP